MNESHATIAARATPPGRGGVSVVRVSGPAAAEVARQITGSLPEPRYAAFSTFRDADGEAIDTGLALFFPAPHSFTGEDVLELQGHGGDVLADLLLARLYELGVRPAEAGEFSRRAFLNDKLDLAQAEAIADLIDSGSAEAARAASRSLRGDFSAAVLELNRQVTQLRVHVEAAMDFPEEEIDFLSDEALLTRLQEVTEAFDQLQAVARQGCLLNDGATVVLVGRPNAGKSSLMNALAGYDAAIVTEIPGTTRDLVREQVVIDGMPLRLVDTAGLREAGDQVEAEGIRRAQQAVTEASHALVVVDANADEPLQSDSLRAELPGSLPVTVVANKTDLGLKPDWDDESVLKVSAHTGEGLERLRSHLCEVLGYEGFSSGSLTARRRHLDSLGRARQHFDAAVVQLTGNAAGELMAADLLEVQNALAEITGEFSSDDLLGEIFSNFCIGK